MNTIKDIAKESYISWGVIAGKIDDNFRELEANVEEASSVIKNLDLTAYKDADACLKQELMKYVDDAIKDIAIPEVEHDCDYAAADASLEATLKSYTITKVQGVREYVNEKINGINVPSLDGYAKLEDIPVMPDLDDFAKLEDIPEVPSLDGYAKLEDIPDVPSLEGYAKLEDIPEVPSLDGYAKLEDIPESPSLEGYAKLEDIPSLDGYLRADEAGNIQLEGYAKLEDIPSVDGFVKAEDIFNNVATDSDIESIFN
jgi:hypothetical protein